MKKYIITAANNKLEMIEAPIPIAGDGEVLIKVMAFGVNRGDVLARQGLYIKPDAGKSSVSPGLEVAGIIEATGQKVCALVAEGGYAQYVVAKKECVFNMPVKLDFAQSAALPEGLCTAWMALCDYGQLKADEVALIHGGSSGIGTFAIQVAKSFCGAKVIATAGEDEQKLSTCKYIGADEVLSYKDDFIAIAKAYGGADVIVDVLGGEYMVKNLKALKAGGRLVSIAVMAGSEANISMGAVLVKGLKIMGTTLRSKPLNIRAEYIKNVQEKLLPLIEQQRIIPVIDSVYQFSDIEAAHERMISRQHIGKIVVEVGG